MRILCFSIALALLAPEAASAETLSLYGVGRGSGGPAHHGLGASPVHPWNASLQDESGNDLGTSTGACLPTDSKNNEICNFIIDHADVGRMVVTGVRAGPLSTAEMIVVGGTGQYVNASGTLTVTPVHDERQDTARLPRRWRYDIELATEK